MIGQVDILREQMVNAPDTSEENLEQSDMSTSMGRRIAIAHMQQRL